MEDTVVVYAFNSKRKHTLHIHIQPENGTLLHPNVQVDVLRVYALAVAHRYPRRLSIDFRKQQRSARSTDIPYGYILIGFTTLNFISERE